MATRNIIDFSGDNIKRVTKIIAGIYKVPKTLIHLALWRTTSDGDRVYFGYWISKPGYDYPVAYQNEDSQIEIVMPNEYHTKWYLKEECVKKECTKK